MMKDIGEQIQSSTGAFQCHEPGTTQPSILDFCMAPGGFLAVALKYNPAARAVAFSLSEKDGGHKIHLELQPNVTVTLQDITMLAGDMGMRRLPPEALDHADADKFCFEPKLAEQGTFNVVLCDGQVLRTHERAAYRENREESRLISVQLALGLERLRPGGSIIVLLHNAHDLLSTLLIEAFSTFSSIKLFKPRSYHEIRSSFYLIATNVLSDSMEARNFVQQYKERWKTYTFGTDVEVEEAQELENSNVERLINDFGTELVQHARHVWAIQAQALAKAPWI